MRFSSRLTVQNLSVQPPFVTMDGSNYPLDRRSHECARPKVTVVIAASLPRSAGRLQATSFCLPSFAQRLLTIPRLLPKYWACRSVQSEMLFGVNNDVANQCFRRIDA